MKRQLAITAALGLLLTMLSCLGCQSVGGVEEVEAQPVVPLHDLAGGGNPDSVKTLIDAGADPNQQDESGKTALHHAAANGHNGTVQVLLQAGADPAIQDRQEKTALDYAMAGGHDETAALLQAAAQPKVKKNFSGRKPTQE